jgi:ribosomal protein L37AE/L43A
MKCSICETEGLKIEEDNIFYCNNCGETFYFSFNGTLTSYGGRMNEDAKRIVRELYKCQREIDKLHTAFQSMM